jgi:hypothetical protein
MLITTTVVASGSRANDLRSVGREVIEALEKSDAVSVVVMLAKPPAMSGGGADPILVRREIAQLQDKVLATLTPSEFRLSMRYANVPAFAGLLFPAGLEKLGADPRVVRVDLDPSGAGYDAMTNKEEDPK